MADDDTKPKKYVGAIDQGTTSTRFIIFDRDARIKASHQRKFEQIYRRPGWVEHDPMEIIDTVHECMSKAVAEFTDKGLSVQEIAAIGITNQRETTVLWDTRTGKPLYNAIVWSDARTRETADHLNEQKGAQEVSERCGLPIATYFAAVKIRWILDHNPHIRHLADRGLVAFGTIDSWIIYNLSGGRKGGLHITDATNAGRTMLVNIKTLKYDEFCIKFFGVERLVLPEIRTCSEVYFNMPVDSPLPGIPVAGILGDQFAALMGQGMVFPGGAKNTYGTGAFVLFNTGENLVKSKNGLLSSCAYHFKDRPPVYCLEGSIAVCGSVVDWLRDGLQILGKKELLDDVVSAVPDSAGVVFVTAFSGLFAPYWRDDARGSLFGLTAYTRREHICRAAMEAVTFQTKAILDAMALDSGQTLDRLRVDGGLTKSEQLVQTQADVLGINVEKPAMMETTALGSAFAAGLAVGFFPDLDALYGINQDELMVYTPNSSEASREANYDRWNRAVDRACGWVTEFNEPAEPEGSTSSDENSEKGRGSLAPPSRNRRRSRSPLA